MNHWVIAFGLFIASVVIYQECDRHARNRDRKEEKTIQEFKKERQYYRTTHPRQSSENPKAKEARGKLMKELRDIKKAQEEDK